MKLPANDYMKYWRVIRYYMTTKHNIGLSDLELILFLFSEGYFKRSKFTEYSEIMRWEKNRFPRLIKEGWIEIFRERTRKNAQLYILSDKARRIVLDIYRKLNGEEIPMSPENNPLFMKNVPYTHKVYRNMIINMTNETRKKIKNNNEAIKEKRKAEEDEY